MKILKEFKKLKFQKKNSTKQNGQLIYLRNDN